MILLVDDDDGVREATKASLQARGYLVRSAASGAEAMAVMREERPTLIVTDVHMAPGDGFDVLRCARGMPEGPAVVLMTAWQRPRDRERARGLGAVAYLSKPFEGGELLSIVERYEGPVDGAEEEGREDSC